MIQILIHPLLDLIQKELLLVQTVAIVSQISDQIMVWNEYLLTFKIS